ncbi:MAG: tetratricopeptide repeat protein [Candidatus Berkelbacteria bacterium]|nr:tetratricopeptide repeat protein [Candidatus Berkelbacteria bacterium]
MIIYPLIILALLIAGFVIVWRRAYLVQKETPVTEDSVILNGNTAAILQEEKEIEPRVFARSEGDETFLKAEDLFSKKQYISAEKWYIEAAKQDPKNSRIYSRLGVIYLDQRNFKDAIDALNEAIKLDSNSASQYFNLSFALNSQGDKKEAIANAKKCVRLDSKNSKYKKWLEELKNKPF